MSEQTLTEKLISILERDRGGAPVDLDAEKPDASIPLADQECYPAGTIFYRSRKLFPDNTAILVRVDPKHCMLICLPTGNRYSDHDVFQVRLDEDGVRKSVFHETFKDEWEVSRRGKEALAEWARTDV